LVAGRNPALGHVALGGYRMIAKPISTAANWYKDAAEGKIPDPVGQALTVAPEAMGIGAAAPIVGKLTEMAPEAAQKTIPAATKAAQGGVRIGARAIEGAVNSKLNPLKAVANVNTLADEAAAMKLKIPGRDLGLPKPPTSNPGAPLPAMPAPEQLNPSIISKSRSMPGQIAPETIKPPASVRSSPIPIRQGLALPPAPEGAELGSLPATKAAPAANTGESLGKIPVKPEAAPPAIAKPNTAPKAIQGQINDSLGGRGLQPGVKLRDQGKIPPSPSAAISDLKPVDSTAVKAYKYDPVKREFTAANPDGQTFIHGDVSAEEAKAFDKASSKGKAWKVIKDNHPLVGKIVNGQRVNHIPSIRSASPN
jgi:hypothetical protein